MSHRQQKRTRRESPTEAPPPQRTRPNSSASYTVVPPEKKLAIKHILAQCISNLHGLAPGDPDTAFLYIQSASHSLAETVSDIFKSRRELGNAIVAVARSNYANHSSQTIDTPQPPPPCTSSASVQTDLVDIPTRPPTPPPRPTYAEVSTSTTLDPPAKDPGSPPRHSATPATRTPATRTPDTRLPRKMMGQRIVVHIGKSSFYSARLGTPAALPKAHKDISDALQKEGSSLQCLGVKLSHSKNLIITFPANSSKSSLASSLSLLRTVLLLPQSVRLSFDIPWAHLQLANVPTRYSPDDKPFSVPRLLEEVRLNPLFKDLAFTRLPSWVSDPSRLTKMRSSVAIAFEDPTGSILRKIKQSEVFMFGASVNLRDWNPRPPTSPINRAIPSDMDTSA